jgi:photosystem II stability/assembly factor-like uncharacterized protein
MRKQAILVLAMAAMAPAVLPAAAQVVYNTGGWEPIGLSGGGAMFTPAISPIDPNLMMLNCDMSCAFLSHDGGMTWRMIHHSQLRANISCRPGFHPKDVGIIFAASGDGRLRVSRDQGKTWKNTGNIEGRLQGEIAIDPEDPNLMFVGADRQVWRSDDSGQRWNKVDSPHGTVIGFHFDRTSPAQSRVCFAATENGVWRSDDSGMTWVEKSNGLPWKGLRGFAGGSNKESHRTVLYCTIPSKDQGGFKGGVYKSTDRGETWTSAMGSGINKDTKGTSHWAPSPIAQYHQVLTTDVKPRTVYACNTLTRDRTPYHATVYRSDNAGKNWHLTYYPTPHFNQFNLEHNYHTAVYGWVWQSVPNGAAIAPTNPDYVLQVNGMLCCFTTDGGNTWKNGHSRPVSKGNEKPEVFFNTGLVVTSTWHYYIDPFQPNRHYIAYTDIGFARSLDGGRSWTSWKGQIPWTNTCYELAFDPDTPGKIWGAFSNLHDVPNGNVITGTHYIRLRKDQRTGGIAFSDDFAVTWKKSNQGLPNAPACSVILDPKSPKGSRTLYAAIYDHGVYKSIDDGKTWTKKSKGLSSPKNMRTCRVQLHKDGTLFCLITAMYLHEERRFEPNGVGLYRSKDAGERWELVNKSQPLLWPKDFTVDPKNSDEIYIGACDIRGGEKQGGLWRTTDGGATWKLIARRGPQHFGAYLHPSHPGWIYMTLCEGAPGAGLWLSKDNGITWQPFDKLPFCNIQRVTFDPGNENVIYVTTFGGSVFKGPAT